MKYKAKSMTDMTPAEILEQHRLTQELYRKLRDDVGDYLDKLLPIYIYGAIRTVEDAFGYLNHQETMKVLDQEKKENGTQMEVGES